MCEKKFKLKIKVVSWLKRKILNVVIKCWKLKKSL